MQVISDRVSILNKDNVFSLVILPTDKKWKLNLLFIWLLLWTMSGVFYVSMYVNFSRESEFYHMQYNEAFAKHKKELLEPIKKDITRTQNARLWVIALIGFWAYFEYKVTRAFYFRKYGREKLWIKNGKMFYQRAVGNRGRIREFDPALINGLEILIPNRGDFFVQMQESFWVVSGERLTFAYASKFIRFGIQLSDAEANKILKELKYELKKY
jgi:hypothetical protein